MWNNLRELLQYRALVWALVQRELKARYRGSVLGFLWTFLNPLLLMAVYQLVFGVFMKQQIHHYTFFIFVGLLPWIWFSNAVSAGTSSLSGKRDLLTRVKFPPQVLPAVTVLAELSNYIMALPLMLLLGLLTGVPLRWTMLLFPFIALIQLLFTLSLVYLTSALNVFFRDLQHLLQNILTLWFFLLPVVYQASSIPLRFRRLVIDLDPLAVFVTSYQSIFYEGKVPNLASLGVALGLSLLLAIFAIQVFEGRRDEFAEAV